MLLSGRPRVKSTNETLVNYVEIAFKNTIQPVKIIYHIQLGVLIIAR